MQQQQSESSLSAALPSYERTASATLSPQPDLEAFPEAVTNRIEDYLDHVCAPLVAQVPFATRREWRSEMQTHLESLTLAHVELSESPELAVEHAIAQFGTSQMVSRQWQQEWEQTGQSNAFAPSLQVARKWYGGAFGLTAALLMVSGDLVNQGAKGAHIASLLFLLTPLVVGVGIGRSVKHPIKATLTAIARCAMPIILMYIVVFTYAKGWHDIPNWSFWLSPDFANSRDNPVRFLVVYGVAVGGVLGLLQMLCWTAISVPAAAVTRWTHHSLLPRLRRRLAR